MKNPPCCDCCRSASSLKPCITSNLLDHRIVRGPCNFSGVCSAGRAIGSRISLTSYVQEIIATLGVECINCQGDIESTDGACLVVAVAPRMVLALNAVAGHRTTCTRSDFPRSRRRRGWDRCGGRLWSREIVGKLQDEEPLLDAAGDDDAALEEGIDAPDAFKGWTAALRLCVEEGGLRELVIRPHLQDLHAGAVVALVHVAVVEVVVVVDGIRVMVEFLDKLNIVEILCIEDECPRFRIIALLIKLIVCVDVSLLSIEPTLMGVP